MSDKSTLVYGLPMVPFKENIPGWIPSQFEIAAPAIGDISVLVIEPGLFHLYLDSDRGSIPQKRTSGEMAEEIIRGFNSSVVGAIPGEAEPILFFVDGEFTKEEIKENFQDKLQEHERRQLNWLTEVIKLADDTWRMTRQHKAISNIARVAAKILNQEREWSITPQEVGQVNCPSCNAFVNSKAIVCVNCKYILQPKMYDAERYATR